MATLEVQAGGSLRQPMSYEAYEALGEAKHHEYYDGQLVVNPPSRRHAVVEARLTHLLQHACPPGLQVLAEWGWQPAPQVVFEPDVMVFDAALPGPDLLRAAPLLVVEVTSRSTRQEDWDHKREAYAAGGAPWYWVVDPDETTVTVLRNERGFAIDRQLTTGVHRLTQPFAIELDLRSVFRLP